MTNIRQLFSIINLYLSHLPNKLSLQGMREKMGHNRCFKDCQLR